MFVKILLALTLLCLPLQATELLMVEREGCPYCTHFNKTLAPIYPKTALGKAAPLKRFDLDRDKKSDYTFITAPRYTPTFILLEGNKELGRIEGFSSDEFFWVVLERLLKQHNIRIEP